MAGAAVFTVFIIAILCRGQSAHAAATERAAIGDGPHPNSEILLWFRGKPVTVAEMTGLSYRQGSALAAGVCREFNPPAAGAVIPGYSPSISGRIWRVPPHGRADAIYRYELDGVLQSFVLRKVQRSIERRFKPKIGKYVHVKLVEKAILADAKADYAGAVVFRRVITAHMGSAASLKIYLRSFPGAHVTLADWRRLLQTDRSNAGAFMICSECFPRVAGGTRVANWYRYNALSALTRYQVGAVIERGPARFVALANTFYAINHFIVLTGTKVSPGLASDFGKLAAAITLVAKKGWGRRLAAADRALRDLGSGSRLRVISAMGAHLHYAYGIPFHAIRPQSVLIGRDHANGAVLMYLPQVLRGQMFKGRHFGPGSFTYDVVVRSLVGPIVDRVLAETKPGGLGLAIPTRRWILSNLSDGWIDLHGFGNGFPSVFTGKTPWTPLPIPGGVTHRAGYKPPHLVPPPPRD